MKPDFSEFLEATQLTIGADPEVFVRKGGRFISAHVFNCGTKEQPQPTRHGFVQVDGLALEFNIPPAFSRAGFVESIKNTMGDLVELVGDECEVCAVPTANFGFKYINDLPPQTKELGCNPDFNAYTLDVNPRPNAELPFRTGAGHIHIGWRWGEGRMTRGHFAACAAIVRELDFTVGLASLQWDKDVKRRKMYGQAGAFRPKPYGVEYRVCSNAWLQDDRLIGRVYDLTMDTCERVRQGKFLYDEHGDSAMKAINAG